jgi:hypothetical protein
MEEERVMYRQEAAPVIDFPALGNAVAQINSGTVRFGQLRNPDSATTFLTALLAEQLSPRQPAPDAIVIVSPKVMLDDSVPEERLAATGRPPCPVFYLNYNANPRGNPWRDTIGKALRFYRALEYSITFPADLGSALADMASRLTSRPGH